MTHLTPEDALSIGGETWYFQSEKTMSTPEKSMLNTTNRGPLVSTKETVHIVTRQIGYKPVLMSGVISVDLPPVLYSNRRGNDPILFPP